MPDAPTYPVIDGEWTYDLALSAVTGGSFDLTKPATPENGWITWDPDLNADKDDIWFQGPVGLSYHTFYAANVNTKALKAWTDAVGAISSVIGEVQAGHHGEMNSQTLWDLVLLVDELADWLDGRAREFYRFSTDLTSSDSGFKGTAAFVIADRLKHYRDGLNDLYTQMTTKNGVGMHRAVYDAHAALVKFGRDMADAWYPVAAYLSDFPRSHIAWWLQQVDEFVDRKGMFTGGGYHTDNYYRGKLAQFPWPAGGTADLTKQATWDAMSTDITTRLKAEIKTYLDTPAVKAMTNLRTVYEASTSAIVALVAPTIPPTVLPKPDAGNGPGPGNLPPPGGPDSLSKVPPPGGPDSLSKVPPPGGPDSLSKVPPPGGPDTLSTVPPRGGLGSSDNLPPPLSKNLAELPPSRGADGPPGGPAGPLPGGPGGLDPGLGLGLGLGAVPPPASTKDRAGRNALGRAPGPQTSGFPGGLGGLPGAGGLPGRSPRPMPPGKASSGSPFVHSSGRHLPELAPPGAGSGLAADGGLPGLGGPGAVSSGLTRVGGPGAAGGQPGNGLPGSGLPGTGLAGLEGLPGTAGSPGAGGGTSGDSQGGAGVPFFPPMMGGAGGMGGPGEKPQERERQTWLSEDEAVWGTDVDAGSGVIGRLDDGDDVEDVLVASLPGQERLHPAVPRRGGSTEQPEETVAHRAAT